MSKHQLQVAVPKSGIEPEVPAMPTGSSMQEVIGNPTDTSWDKIVDKHTNRAKQMLNRAFEMSEKDGKLSASERMRLTNHSWNAVVQTIKALAAIRGWTSNDSGSTKHFIYDLTEKNKDITARYGFVEYAHRNYYSDLMDEDVARSVPVATAELIRIIWENSYRVSRLTKPPKGFDAIRKGLIPFASHRGVV